MRRDTDRGRWSAKTLRLTRVLRENHNVENPWQGADASAGSMLWTRGTRWRVVSGQVHIARLCLDRLVRAFVAVRSNRYRYDGPWAADLDDFFCLRRSHHVFGFYDAPRSRPLRASSGSLRFGALSTDFETLAPILTLLHANGSPSVAADAYIDALLAAIKLGSAGADCCLSVGDKRAKLV